MAFGLVYWLVKDGKIDFSQLRLFWQRPALLGVNVGYWLFVALALGALRWKTLMAGLLVQVKYLRVCLYTLIGFFFNAAMPGAVGGDIIKAIYIIRTDGKHKKTPTLLSILLDRVMGMFGLFTIAFVAVLFNYETLFSNPLLKSLGLATMALFTAIFIFFLSVFFPIGRNDLIARLFSLNVPGFSLLGNVYASLCRYRQNPGALILAWLISIAIQGSAILYMWFLCGLLGMSDQIEFSVFASITPLGILTTALPLAPGGMGIGHVAFDRILNFAGVSGGANIFNIFFLGQMSLNLLGLIPYLLFKKPTEEELKLS